MLKQLFTSGARVKLLTEFLLNPDEEYYIRELTRKLDEQINSIRRELNNLNKIGLLKTRKKNRKKFYYINKQFVLYNELKNIFLKANSSKEAIIKRIASFGNIDLLILAGTFVQKDHQVDLLIVGTDIDRSELEDYLSREVKSDEAIRFSIMNPDDFTYRLKCNDKFITDLLNDPDNIVAIDNILNK